jgi:hypothetical protein
VTIVLGSLLSAAMATLVLAVVKRSRRLGIASFVLFMAFAILFILLGLALDTM